MAMGTPPKLSNHAADFIIFEEGSGAFILIFSTGGAFLKDRATGIYGHM